MLKTTKIYYQDSFLNHCEAIVTAIQENRVILDRTISFPEGGGQIGDRGYLYVNDLGIPFFDTQKGVGRILSLPEFPSVQVDTPIYHFIDEKDLSKIVIGDRVKVVIDVQRRIWTTVLHSALHLVLMVAKERRPDITSTIKGCKITTESARIDFFAKVKFLPEDVEWISKRAQELIDLEIPIRVYPHLEEKEAWYWSCKDFICPCGGTHLTNTGQIGKIFVKRKNVGKTTERLIVTADDIKLFEKDYH